MQNRWRRWAGGGQHGRGWDAGGGDDRRGRDAGRFRGGDRRRGGLLRRAWRGRRSDGWGRDGHARQGRGQSGRWRGAARVAARQGAEGFAARFPFLHQPSGQSLARRHIGDFRPGRHGAQIGKGHASAGRGGAAFCLWPPGTLPEFSYRLARFRLAAGKHQSQQRAKLCLIGFAPPPRLRFGSGCLAMFAHAPLPAIGVA